MKLLPKRTGCFLQLLELKVKARIGGVHQHANQRGVRDKLLQKCQTFGHLLGKQPTDASDIAPSSIEVGNETDRNGDCAGRKSHRNSCGCRLGRETRRLSADGNNDGHLPTHERGRKRRQPVVLTICPAVVDHDVLTLDEASYVQSLANDGDKLRIDSGRTAAEESDHRQPTLLRPGRKWPSRCRAAYQRDDLAAPHSITSSARASSIAGTSRPSALAVVRLMTKSNLVGCSTGSSAGLVPRRIRSTKSAARRKPFGMFGP